MAGKSKATKAKKPKGGKRPKYNTSFAFGANVGKRGNGGGQRGGKFNGGGSS